MVEEQPTTPTVLLSDTELRVLHQLRGENNRISFDEAAEIALGAFGSFGSPSGGSSLAKSAPARRIGSVKVLRTEARGGSSLAKAVGDAPADMSDTIAYVFNFENESGFAVVAADVRVEEPLLAYCDNGSLGDTIDNPGLALFLEGAGYYVERSIAEGQRLRDSMLADILAKIWENGVIDTIYHSDYADVGNNANAKIANDALRPYCDLPGPHISYSYGKWEVVERVGPLLPVEWRQGPPFNNNVPKDGCTKYDNGKAPAGCGAIATAQLMAYWRHPSSLGGMTFEWNLLRNYTSRPNKYPGVGTRDFADAADKSAAINKFRIQAAHLVRQIGAKINLLHTCDNTLATASDAVEFLRDNGYTYGVSGWFNRIWELGFDYDGGTSIKSLNNRRPILISGASGKTAGIPHDGHIWVIDGLLKQRRLVTETITVIESSSSQPLRALAKLAPGFIDRPLMPFCIRSTTTKTYYQTSPYYLHNNWGWGDSVRKNASGKYVYTNGYYVAGCFNSVPGADVPSNTLSKSSGEDHNYKYRIKIFPNIYR